MDADCGRLGTKKQDKRYRGLCGTWWHVTGAPQSSCLSSKWVSCIYDKPVALLGYRPVHPYTTIMSNVARRNYHHHHHHHLLRDHWRLFASVSLKRTPTRTPTDGCVSLSNTLDTCASNFGSLSVRTSGQAAHILCGRNRFTTLKVELRPRPNQNSLYHFVSWPESVMMALSISQQSLWLPSLTLDNRKSISAQFTAVSVSSATTRICATRRCTVGESGLLGVWFNKAAISYKLELLGTPSNTSSGG